MSVPSIPRLLHVRSSAALDIDYAGAYADIVASCPALDEALTIRP
jgi:hypothetical protein